MKIFQFKQYCQNLMRKEKSYWNRKRSWKQEPDNYGIDQFQSILSNGRTYPWNILHGRMKILYKSTWSYSSIEDNTCLKERGMLRPYINSVVPYYVSVAPLLFTPITLILLLLCHYIIIVRSARVTMWPH